MSLNQLSKILLNIFTVNRCLHALHPEPGVNNYTTTTTTTTPTTTAAPPGRVTLNVQTRPVL